MLIVLGIYAGLIWLIFFKLKLLSWNRGAQVIVGLTGLAIVLVVMGLLNTRTPSGRVTVVAHVVEIAPLVGGIVTSVPVEPNHQVEEGTVLLEIDPKPYQYSVDEATADFKIAEITFERKKSALEKTSAAVSLQSLDESRAAQASARARLDKALYDLEQTVVRAPTRGVVTSLGVSIGDQARPLSPVMPFIRADSLFLAGVFAQNGLDAMPPGTPVQISLVRKPGRLYTSEVVEIAAGTSSGQISAGSKLLSAVDIGSTDEALVVLAWPEDLDRDVATAGTVGTATAFGPDAGAMGLLATILMYMKMLGTYL